MLVFYTLITRDERNGFTLIELLVVIAIISIVGAILLPVFAKAREKARQTACISNARQLTMAFIQYEQDYDERLPSATDGGAASGRPGGWVYYNVFPANQTIRSFDVTRGTVYPYVNNTQIYVCPSDAEGKRSGNSYAANSCVFMGQALGLEPGKAAASFDAPSNFLLLGEEAVVGAEDNTSTDDGYLLFRLNAFSTRHIAGSVITFVDGHTKWMRPDQTAAAALQTGGVNMAQCP